MSEEREYGLAGRTLPEIRALYAEHCRPGQAMLYQYMYGEMWDVAVFASLEAAEDARRVLASPGSLWYPDWIYDGERVHERFPENWE